MNELALAAIYCILMLGGETETRIAQAALLSRCKHVKPSLAQGVCISFERRRFGEQRSFTCLAQRV